MITINLLPHDLRPIKRTPLPYIAGAAILAAVIVMVGFLFVKEQSEISTAEATFAKNKADLTALDPIVKEANDLAQKTKQLAVQAETIKEIVNDRIIWSRQLHNLSRLAKSNMWYKSILQTSRPFMETKQEFDQKAQKMILKTTNVTLPVLVVSGYVIASTEGEVGTNPIIEAFEDDPEFSSLFVIEPPTTGQDTIEDLSVTTFEIPFKIMPSGGAAQ